MESCYIQESFFGSALGNKGQRPAILEFLTMTSSKESPGQELGQGAAQTDMRANMRQPLKCGVNTHYLLPKHPSPLFLLRNE